MWAVREVGYHNLVFKATPFSSSQSYRWKVQVGSTGLYDRVSQAKCQGVGAGPYPDSGKTRMQAHSGVGEFGYCSGRTEGLGPS